MIRQIKNKPMYILFVYISEVHLFTFRCKTCMLNKPNHPGDEAKRLTFRNILIMHLGLFFRLPIFF